MSETETMPRWFSPDAVFDGQVLRHGVHVGVDAAGVVRLSDALPEGQVATPLAGTISPGFIDLQVNGGGDALFNTSSTPEGIATIAAAHRGFGTVGILPTVITDRAEVMTAAVDALMAAWGQDGILGIHIEGPHLAPARRGTHAADFVRPMEPATIAHVRRLRKAAIPVMITLAPEAADLQDIALLSGLGAVVSIGHSDATAAETRAALTAGAGCFTHLFNAMSPMLNRAPGVVGAAINSTAYAGVICDGIHVADEMIGLAIRARPVPDRMFLVSDAMPTVGGSGRFRLYDMEVHLEAGRLVNDEGSLAGAHTTMAEGLARLINVVGIDPVVALRMAVTVPATVIGRGDLASVAARQAKDMVVLDQNWGFAGSLAAQP